jgi:uncharacterized protein (TIRG00374 family)
VTESHLQPGGSPADAAPFAADPPPSFPSASGASRAGRSLKPLGLRLGVSAAIGAFFVWVLHAGALPLVPERGVWAAFHGWTLLAYLLGWSLVHLVRAGRWQLLLAPLAQVPMRRIFAASFLGFLAILMLPLRTGEVVRPMLIRDRRRLTVWAAAGTLGAERIADGLVLSVMLFLALLLARPIEPLPDHLGDLPIRVSMVPTTAYLALIGFTGALLSMLAFYVWKEPTRRLLERLVGRFSPRFSHWISTRLEGLAEGLSFLSGRRHALPFVLLTILYWLLNAACTWLLAWGAGLAGFTLIRGCVVTGVLAVGILVPNAPGFFGAFQFSVYAALAMFYPREQVFAEGALFVFLLYLGQMLVTFGFAAWAAWFGGLELRGPGRDVRDGAV